MDVGKFNLEYSELFTSATRCCAPVGGLESPSRKKKRVQERVKDNYRK